MYYGNPSVSSQSNGDATFVFFDDFAGTSLDTSKWTLVNGPAVTYENSKCKVSATSWDNQDSGLEMKNALLHDNFRLLLKTTGHSTGNGNTWNGITYPSYPGWTYGLAWGTGYDDCGFFRTENGVRVDDYPYPESPTFPQTSVLETVRDSNYSAYENGVARVSSHSFSDGVHDYKFFVNCHLGVPIVWFELDWIGFL